MEQGDRYNQEPVLPPPRFIGDVRPAKPFNRGLAQSIVFCAVCAAVITFLDNRGFHWIVSVVLGGTLALFAEWIFVKVAKRQGF